MKYLIAIAILVLAVGIFLHRSSHVWHRYDGGEVLRDGSAVPASGLFETSEGYILIDVGDRNEWYAFYPNEIFMGYCNQPRGFSLFGLWYITPDDTIPCVTFSPVKAEEPHLQRSPEFIEFDSRNGGRIRVVLRRV